MEEERIKLVRRLCCEAGSIMENVSPVALITSNDPSELRATIDQLSFEIGRARTIVDAAGAILEQSDLQLLERAIR